MNSLALLADARHNLSDVGWLILAWLHWQLPGYYRRLAARLDPRQLYQCRNFAGGHGLARLGVSPALADASAYTA
ncbi:hypothetical protein [Pseudomonas arsenicoxydans]|uniref:hypothetical protein n=1 Tax=Pseudomonas arsenicoxydans TaxID=702115 RepID=UPI001E29071B|nr:hypothetical protein [Pseudomonas arsenicoxydans]